MHDSALHSQLATFSEIHGFLNHFFSHQFRYGGGTLLDESGKYLDPRHMASLLLIICNQDLSVRLSGT
jgi:hypothetical protein